MISIKIEGCIKKKKIEIESGYINWTAVHTSAHWSLLFQILAGDNNKR